MPRKTTGCWTCRARKKKCDDARPYCLSCSLRAITCYGYEAKPAWMDGADAERRMMDEMKHQTKESYRRRRTKRPGTGTSDRSRRRTMPRTTPAHPEDAARSSSLSFLPPSPYLAERRSASESSTPWSSFQPRPDHGASHEAAHASEERLGWRPSRLHSTATTNTLTPGALDQGDATVSPSHDPRMSVTPRNEAGTRYSYSEQDLNLVMYYLDHIFPRLCPYFKYSAADKGRGWLLNLFLRTKPLCTAVVCLSACDQAQFVLGPLSDLPQPDEELEMQHLQSVADLRDHLHQLSATTEASHMAASVEALACIMHLILFELWIPRRGLKDDWVMHLDAASLLLASLEVPSTGSALSSASPASSTSDWPHLEGQAESNIAIELLSDSERSAFQFFLTQYTVCFIVSTATLGLTPQTALSIPRTRAIYHQDQCQIKDMVGCEDWVMLTILDITILKDWKQKKLDAGTLNVRELTRHADRLEERLTHGLITLLTASSPPQPATAEAAQDAPGVAWEEPQHMVTTIYIRAALVFLHVVVSGFYPNVPEIRHGVLQTLEALEHMRGHSPINFPSWPYCVAGCLAREAEYPRFRALVPPVTRGKHPLVMSKWTLDILEECWKIRRSRPAGDESCDWATAMEQLGTRLLML